jgi:hypothetical protein
MSSSSFGGKTESNRAAHHDNITQFLEVLTIDKSECLHADSDGVCVSDRVVPAIAAVAGVPQSVASKSEVVKAAAAVLGCSTETCVVTHPRTQKAAQELSLAKALSDELAHKFKPPGPRNSTALLSNVHIDNVLKQWAEAEFPDFYACPFAMADFNTNGDKFATVKLNQLRQKQYRTFGCVMNTDNSKGPGTHWVAVFVDMRAEVLGPEPWSIEYFNSAGRPPATPVVRWMEQTRGELAKMRETASAAAGAITGTAKGEIAASAAQANYGPVQTWAVSSVSHQRSQTECGPYALYYIRRRLEGAAPKDFMEASNKIPDAAMVEFRRHLFRSRQA